MDTGTIISRGFSRPNPAAFALYVSLDYLVTGTEAKPAPREADDFRHLAKKMRRFSKTDLRTVIESIGEKYGM